MLLIRRAIPDADELILLPATEQAPALGVESQVRGGVGELLFLDSVELAERSDGLHAKRIVVRAQLASIQELVLDRSPPAAEVDTHSDALDVLHQDLALADSCLFLCGGLTRLCL